MTFGTYDIRKKEIKMNTSWKDHFMPSNFLLNHSNPQIFITSQWQPDKDTPNVLYLLMRLAIFLTFFVILILSYTMESDDGKQKWPVYLTNWGLTICTIQAFLASVMLTCAVLGAKVFENQDLIDNSLKIYKIYWIANATATTVAFTISFVYWTLIHQAEYWSTMNFLVHGMNSILMFIDFCVVAHPVRLLHFVYPVCFTSIYLCMTAIYYACGGTAKAGSKYIYPILKWDEPGLTIAYCIGIAIVMTLIHGLTFFLHKGKYKIAELCFGSDDSDSASDTAMQML